MQGKIRSNGRLIMIRNHLNQNLGNLELSSNDLDKWRKKITFDKNLLREIYYPFHNDLRQNIHKIIAENPEFKHHYMLEMNSSEEQKLGVVEINKLMSELSKTTTLKEIRSDLKKFNVFIDSISQFEPSIATKFVAHSVLYYNSLKNIGTSKHQVFIERSHKLQDIGCFCMTEFGHGSNVKEIQTTSTYDATTHQFVLNSPKIESYKWWIGGLGKTANIAIVFAQLFIKGHNYGIHCFLTPLRDLRDHQVFPGVILGSTGPKLGNELIDTGFVGFRNYRIPLDNLLDRFSTVTPEGNFMSKIENSSERFALALGTLLEGRVLVCGLTQTIMANALCVAGRYAAIRKQFGQGHEENFILNYPLVNYRIIPALADNFAFKICSFHLQQKWVDLQSELTNKNSINLIENHAILSVLKPLSSWNSHFHIQKLREVMGANGYSRFSLIGFFRNINDTNLTWEGDNNVLLQQGTKFLIDNYKKILLGKEIEFKVLVNLKESLYFMKKEINGKTKLRIDSPKSLYDLNILRDLFEFRVNSLLGRSFEKIMRNEKQLNNLDNFNNAQVFYFQKATLAYGELYIFNQFVLRIIDLEDNETKGLLKNICVLFSLNNLEKDLDILRDRDFIGSETCYLIKEEIMNLCELLKDQLIPIIDVIAPRDEILGAPLGYSDGKNFDRYINKVFSHKECFERPTWWDIIHKNIVK